MSNAFNLSQLANNVNSSGLLSASAGITGTLPVANGGTGAATLTANNVILGNGTSAPTFVAPSTNGNVLTSNGTTWTSVAPAGGGVTSLNGQTGAVVDTTLYAIGSYALGGPLNANGAAVNTTIAGSTMYATCTAAVAQVNEQGQSAWNSPAGATLINTGSYRCVSPFYAGYGGQAYCGLWVRYA